MEAAPEKIASVALLNWRLDGANAFGVIDVDPASHRYGQEVARVNIPNAGDVHHYGWNACPGRRGRLRGCLLRRVLWAHGGMVVIAAQIGAA